MDKHQLSMTKEDFNSYTIQVTRDDINKIRKVYRPKWFENVPLFGTQWFYTTRLKMHFKSLDGRILRKEIAKQNLKFTLLGLFIISLVIFVITPWAYYFVITQAIKEADKQLIELENMPNSEQTVEEAHNSEENL